MNIGIANEKMYTSTSNSASATVGISNKKYGFSGTLTHIDHTEEATYNEIINHNNPMVMPWTIYKCSNSTLELTMGSSHEIFSNDDFAGSSVTEINNENVIFIGIDISGFVGVGGHVKIGFNIER